MGVLVQGGLQVEQNALDAGFDFFGADTLLLSNLIQLCLDALLFCFSLYQSCAQCVRHADVRDRVHQPADLFRQLTDTRPAGSGAGSLRQPAALQHLLHLRLKLLHGRRRHQLITNH
ncbi:hypothetical protein [Undibacterium luofuense]|uniref:hypothetical protein n=1 Tax=Undibacterium luofuense TaxID=2828733 RepID=UPI001E44CB28|nr:hypothetical protein [Undibacterium luofuense]